MITCPKCRTENPDNATNCKSCSINLAFALSHPEQFGLGELPQPIGKEISESRGSDIKTSTSSPATTYGLISKNISPAIFGIVLLLFFLPWVEVSCSGHRVATFSGIQLATGATVQEQKTKGEALAVLALLCTIAGLAFCFIKGRRKDLYLIAVSVAGIIMILLLKLKLDGDVMREGRGIVHLSYGAGYYLTLVSFLSVIGINSYCRYEGKGKSFFQSIQGQSGHKFCTECGSKNTANNAFCRECGTKFS